MTNIHTFQQKADYALLVRFKDGTPIYFTEVGRETVPRKKLDRDSLARVQKVFDSGGYDAIAYIADGKNIGLLPEPLIPSDRDMQPVVEQAANQAELKVEQPPMPALITPDTTPGITVSNAQFAKDMFGTLPHGQFCWATSFSAPPKEAGGAWKGHKILPEDIQDTRYGNAYFSVASLKFGADNIVKKDNDHFAALHTLVLDDTKNAALKPTYKLETSPDNFQLGFKLTKPITDFGIASRLHEAIAKADLDSDKSGNMAVRYVRLPVGCNTKDQPHFKCKLHEYDPEITYTLEQLIESLELDGEYILNGGRSVSSIAPASSQTNNVVSVDAKTITDIRSALLFLRADDYDLWIRIGMALKTLGEVGRGAFMEWSTTSEKFNPADAARTWDSLNPTRTDHKVVFAEAQRQGWLNPRSNATSGGVERVNHASESKETKEKHDPVEMIEVTIWSDTKKNPVPEELTKFPTPKLNAFCNWFDRSVEDTVRGVSIVGVIHLASITVSRGAQSCKHNCSGLFIAIIARTGLGKNYGKNSPKKILRAAGVCFDISGSFTSASAIYSALRRCPSATFHLDELGDRLKNGFQDKGGYMPAAWQFTKEVYSSTHDALEKPSMGTSGLTTKQIADHRKVNLPVINPVLNVLGLTTPDQLWTALDDASVEGGFINRFVMVDIDEYQVFENPEPEYDPPAELVEHIRKVRTFLGGAAVSMLSYHEGADELLKTDPVYSNPDAPADFKIYPFDEESLRLLDIFKKEIKQRYGRDSFMESVSARWRENAMRMALGLAVFDDPEREQIPAVITQWCIEYVHFYGRRFAAGLTRHAQPVELYGKARKAFLLAFQDKPEGTAASDLGRLKPWRDSQPRQRAEIIDDLLNARLIKKVYQDIDSRKSRGPRAWRYYALSN